MLAAAISDNEDVHKSAKIRCDSGLLKLTAATSLVYRPYIVTTPVMDQFTSYVFKENELRTNNAKVTKERTYYLGILIVLVGLAMYYLNIPYGLGISLAGTVVYIIGKFIMSGWVSSIGYRPYSLKIRKESITIGDRTFDVNNTDDVQFKIVGYKGQIILQREAIYKTHSGNENLVMVRYNNLESEFRFVLESEEHKDKLLKFCENTGFSFKYGIRID